MRRFPEARTATGFDLPQRPARRQIFAIKVPFTHSGVGGVYFRWYGYRFQRLPDLISKGPSEDDPERPGLWYSHLGRYNAERDTARAAVGGNYTKPGTMVLGLHLRERSRWGYVWEGEGFTRPAMWFDYQDDANEVRFFNATGAHGTKAVVELTLYEAIGHDWLATTLHQYRAAVPQVSRFAPGRPSTNLAASFHHSAV